MSNLIIGCGYLGNRVGQLWLKEGKSVHTITRFADRATLLTQAGYQPIVWDVTDQRRAKLPEVDTVLWAVGFDRSAHRDINHVYVDGLRNMLPALAGRCRRIIYISSTGVYSQSAGEWVDETSVCEPQAPGGRACLAAEHLIQTHALKNQAVILRMAGIYGPDRIPRGDDVRHGKPIRANPDSYLNLIHVDDAARAVKAAEQSLETPELYVIADGHPVMRRHYYSYVARLLDAAEPEFAPPANDSANIRRGSSNKRTRNDKMLRQLRLNLYFPTYQDGLERELGAGPSAG